MKRGLVIVGIVLAGLVALAFIIDALTAKPQREILIDHNYRAPAPQADMPAPESVPADNILTPAPE